MAAKDLHILLSPLLVLSSILLLQVNGYDVKYTVTNVATSTPGGKRFNVEIGEQFTIELMKDITQFIWNVFQQPTDADRKYVPTVNIYINETLEGAMGQIGQNNIYINAESIQQYFPPSQAKFWFASLLYHETTHIFQWNGEGTAPGGLTEGIADYVMVKSNYYDPNNYDKPGSGNKWDEGYGVTARFLEYCDSLKPGFTTDLNNKMREVYKDAYFQDLLGKPLDQVWSEYKIKYGI